MDLRCVNRVAGYRPRALTDPPAGGSVSGARSIERGGERIR